jgi:diacylglycerol kinase
MSKTHSTFSSFSYAFSGIRLALKNEPNIRVHFVVAILVAVVAYFLKFSRLEWIVLAFTVAFVLILELINTTLEEIVDMVSPGVRQRARVAKDVSAAAVLISALLAVVIGGFLFLPKILPLLNK